LTNPTTGIGCVIAFAALAIGYNISYRRCARWHGCLRALLLTDTMKGRRSHGYPSSFGFFTAL
jgi:hypothetical protein